MPITTGSAPKALKYGKKKKGMGKVTKPKKVAALPTGGKTMLDKLIAGK